jgi:site-specific recombinase XerD
MRFEEFLEDLQIERWLSPATLRARRSYLGMFFKFLQHPLEECSTRDIKIALSKCREKYKPNTFGMLLYITNIYLEWEALPNIDLKEIKKIRAPGKDHTTSHLPWHI